MSVLCPDGRSCIIHLCRPNLSETYRDALRARGIQPCLRVRMERSTGEPCLSDAERAEVEQRA